MGHAIPGVEGVYDRHRYDVEKAHALQALSDLIDRMCDLTPVREKSQGQSGVSKAGQTCNKLCPKPVRAATLPCPEPGGRHAATGGSWSS